MQRRGRHVARMGLAAALIAAAAGTVQAQSVEEFYRGRSMPLIIGFSVGSAYDLYARHLARFMGRYIPGNPTIVPQNMPGAGSQRAAQYIYSVAPKDGSVFGTMSRSMPIEPLLGDAKFDGRAFTWIGNIANNNSLCAMWHTVGIKTWQDVITKPYRAGRAGAGLRPRPVRHAVEERVRRQGEDGHRLSGRQRRQPGDGAARDRRSLRLVMGQHQKHAAGLDPRQEDRSAAGVRAGEVAAISRPRFRSRSTRCRARRCGRSCAFISQARRSAGRSPRRPAFLRTARLRCARPSTPP